MLYVSPLESSGCVVERYDVAGALYDRAMAQDVTVFVLAGGKSTRMGKDKALVVFEGRTLLDRALETARKVSPDVRIAGDLEKYAAFAPCIPDVYPQCGPLSGINAALRSTHTDFNVMLAVDLPFVTGELLQFLLDRARVAATAVVTIPRADHGLQPLCAVYRREFVVKSEQAMRAQRYKIDALFDWDRTQVVEEDMLRAAGFSPQMFRNLNTPEDLAAAEEKAGR